MHRFTGPPALAPHVRFGEKDFANWRELWAVFLVMRGASRRTYVSALAISEIA